MKFVVKPGDCPWKLALQWTGNSARWPELIVANPHKPRSRDGNFATLHPGEELNVPPTWLAERSRPDAAGVDDTPTTPDLPPSSAPLMGAAGPALQAVATYPKRANKGKAWLDEDFFLEVLKLARDVGANPANLLLVWASESDLAPWATNPKGAHGLSQLTKVAAGVTGHPWEWVKTTMLTLSAAEQVREAVRPQYLHYAQLRKGKGFPNAQSLYAFNATPGVASSVGVADTVVLMRKGDGLYENNSLLDLDADGAITVGDLRERLARKQHDDVYKLALAALNEVAASRGLPVFAPNFKGESPTVPADARLSLGPIVPLGCLLALLFLVSA